MAITRIKLLTIPLDILPDEDIEQTIMDMLDKGEPQHIVFITIWNSGRCWNRRRFVFLFQKVY